MAIKYDYIICGAGAAGLSLALRLTATRYKHLNILIIDKTRRTGNDHTWCFWENGPSPYDDLLSSAYDHIYFHSDSFSKRISIAPYRYKMLQSSPFYAFAWEKINDSPHIHFVEDAVLAISEKEDRAVVQTSGDSFESSQVFTSIFTGDIDKSEELYVDQHFKGWFIKSQEDIFDPGTATFMDFRIDQEGECRFFYVLPSSTREALVEIAIFSNDLLKVEDYDPIIEKYIADYIGKSEYDIVEKEYGVIPMTSYPFWKHASARIFPIGAAGGAVKPSSGFAFKRIQEHSDSIAEAIAKGEAVSQTYDAFKSRFYLYDKILLDVILKQNKPGDDIFTDLFKHNKASSVFKFLDGKTSLLEESRIFTTLPISPFLRGWFRHKLGL